VITEVPTVFIETMFLEMVATAVLPLVYVNSPLLLETGFTIAKSAMPISFKGITKLATTGVPLFTKNNAVMVAAE
jgi:hypothetical protein